MLRHIFTSLKVLDILPEVVVVSLVLPQYPKLYSAQFFNRCQTLERLVSVYKVPLFLGLVLGLVEYGNDYFMLETTKFNRLSL